MWKSVSKNTMSEEAGFCKSFIGKADSERGWSTCRKEDKADANRQDSVTDPKVYDKGGGVAIKFRLYFLSQKFWPLMEQSRAALLLVD